MAQRIGNILGIIFCSAFTCFGIFVLISSIKNQNFAGSLCFNITGSGPFEFLCIRRDDFSFGIFIFMIGFIFVIYNVRSINKNH